MYVSYQTRPSVPPSYTSVVESSSNPTWEYQKLERISYSSLNTSQVNEALCFSYLLKSMYKSILQCLIFVVFFLC